MQIIFTLSNTQKKPTQDIHIYAFYDLKQVQTSDRNVPDATCYWCCVVNVLIIHFLQDHMHYSPPSHLSSSKNHATGWKTVQKREKEAAEEARFATVNRKS